MKFIITILFLTHFATGLTATSSMDSVLHALGLNAHNVRLSKRLNGNNGYNGYYFYVACAQSEGGKRNFRYTFYLLSPKQQVLELPELRTRCKSKTPETFYFEIRESTLFVVNTRKAGSREEIDLYQFDLHSGKLLFSMPGEVPSYAKDNDWIDYTNSTATVFTNLRGGHCDDPEKAYALSSYYTYNWADQSLAHVQLSEEQGCIVEEQECALKADYVSETELSATRKR